MITNVKLKNILLFIVILCSYLQVVFFEYNMIANLIVAISTLIVYVAVFKFHFHKLTVLFTLLTLIIFSVTFDISKLSITVIIMLYYIFKDSDSSYLKNYFLISFCLFLVIVTSSFILNLNMDKNVYHWRQGFGLSYRYSLGFIHANQAMIKFFTLALAFLFMSKKRLLPIVITIIATLTIYEFTVSRTTMVVIFFVTGAYVLPWTNKKFQIGHNNYIFASIFIYSILISYILSVYFHDSQFNVFLTGRLAINKYFLDMGIPFFGYTDFADVFDNSYLHMLLTNGILYTLMYSFVFFLMLYKKKVTIKTVIFIGGIFLLGFMETVFLKVDLFLLMVLIIDYDYSYQKSKKTSKNSTINYRYMNSNLLSIN